MEGNAKPRGMRAGGAQQFCRHSGFRAEFAGKIIGRAALGQGKPHHKPARALPGFSQYFPKLISVVEHEIAHADLGHVQHQQLLQTGLGIGISLLDQLFPGSSALTPIAGQFMQSAYSRNEELEADAHGVTILRRAGYDGKKIVGDTLGWLSKQDGGSGGGGFFSTHPATGDRIQAVRNLQ
jgi:predicted Zn-dependent protease